jgi:hypothetical protein
MFRVSQRSWLWSLGACAVGCSSPGQGVASHADSGVPDGAPGDERASLADTGLADTGLADAGPAVTAIELPGAAPGIGFDDLRYAPVLKKVLAPGGRSGNLDLVDPDTLAVTPVGGFSASTTFSAGSHGAGTTSADEGGGRLFAIDHETQSVRVVDPATRAIIATTTLAGGPDYVRWVESTGEIWITEPSTGIEVLTAPAGGAPVHAATISVTGGPEAIVVDNSRHRVYTNSFVGQTYAIDIARRTVVETWTNGCSPLSLGIALDEARGFVFVACAAGSVVLLDAANGGTKLGEIAQGSDLDILSYSASLHHLYVPGGTSADLGIIGISAAGAATLLGTVPTAQGAKEVTSDSLGNAWVADPAGGRLLKVQDTYPPMP